MQAERFADNALDPVTAHGITYLAVHTDTQAAVSLITCQVNKGKSVAAQPSPTAVYLIKLPGFPEKTGLGEPVLLHQAYADSRFRPLARLLLITA
jgi:hypothetical protein